MTLSRSRAAEMLTLNAPSQTSSMPSSSACSSASSSLRSCHQAERASRLSTNLAFCVPALLRSMMSRKVEMAVEYGRLRSSSPSRRERRSKGSLNTMASPPLRWRETSKASCSAERHIVTTDQGVGRTSEMRDSVKTGSAVSNRYRSRIFS